MAITLSSTGYCAVADVQAEVQQFTISTTSKPTTAQVELMITEDFAEINGLLRGAGYATPVAQAGGTLAVTSGDITVSTAASAGTAGLTLTGTGLAGIVVEGDHLTVAGQDQAYMITQLTRASSANEIGVYFAPALEEDAAAAAVVTYTAGTGAAEVLKKLNRSMSAIRVVRSAYSAHADSADGILVGLLDERDRLMLAIKNGDYDFPAIAEADPTAYATSNVDLVRT